MPVFSRFDAMTMAFCTVVVSVTMLSFMLLLRVTLPAVDRRLDAWIAGDALLFLGRFVVVAGLVQDDLWFGLSPFELMAPLAFVAVCIHALALRLARYAAINLVAWIPAGLAALAAFYRMEGGGASNFPVRELSFALLLGSWVWMLYEAVRVARGSFGGKVLVGMSAVILLADVAIVFVGVHNPTTQFGLFVQLLLAVVSTPCFLMWYQENLRLKLTEIAVTDALTGTLNRHGLMPRLERAVAHARNFQRPLSVVLCDLDHFKQVNDVHGHQLGDRVLQHFADLTQRSLRNSDLLSRWGGEEFLIVLPDTALPVATAIAERIRAACEVSSADLPRFTVSAGVASVDESDWNGNIDSLLAQADQRLYAAKATRNCVVSREADPAGAGSSKNDLVMVESALNRRSRRG